MTPAEFDLQHADIPQPKELDGELATRDWPMPPVKPWAPAPERESWLAFCGSVWRALANSGWQRGRP